jgi:hypothetical protein
VSATQEVEEGADKLKETFSFIEYLKIRDKVVELWQARGRVALLEERLDRYE